MINELNQFEKVSRYNGDNFIYPERATQSAVGYDIYIQEDITVLANSHKLIPTFLKWKHRGQIDTYLRIVGRSSNYKRNLQVFEGTIDADYYNNVDNEGEMFISVRNYGDKDVELKTGDRVAQVILAPFKLMTDDTMNEKKRIGGFGSTGDSSV